MITHDAPSLQTNMTNWWPLPHTAHILSFHVRHTHTGSITNSYTILSNIHPKSLHPCFSPHSYPSVAPVFLNSRTSNTMGKWSEGSNSWAGNGSQVYPWRSYRNQWRLQWFWVQKLAKCPKCSRKYLDFENRDTFQGINMSHLGKRKIIDSKVPAGKGYVSSLEVVNLLELKNWILPHTEINIVSALKPLQSQHQRKIAHWQYHGWGTKTKEEV